ncbi:hypothetical protein HPP92_013309 [Vanilla planifolia]|uniref:eRF1/Pelota-like N-terminal domain-containing protein n=1 Tax=Vanilla planifolia TaxID=51239 RepID=A0A835UWJ2_VANPL|nr:hypothetical protein HPP92_013309 [Vanilla planifolia]
MKRTILERIELLDSLDGCVIGLGLVSKVKHIAFVGGEADAYDTDRNIETWKIKKLIRALESARVNGTSMISLILTHRDQISRVAKMLGDEYEDGKEKKVTIDFEPLKPACL